MVSLRQRFFNQILRWTVRRRLARTRDLLALRAIFGSRDGLAPFGSRFQDDRLGAIDGEWALPRNAGITGGLLYLHGGGYVAMSCRTHRAITGGFAKRGFKTFAPNYRLAPENPFPAALDDAHAAWTHFRQKMDGPLFLAGDSAGGGLALALMLRLRDEGAALPTGAVLYSPWTDLTISGPSHKFNADRDPTFPPTGFDGVAALYAGSHPLNDPLISPLFGRFEKFPPTQVFVGETELLLDDSRLLAERMKAAGAICDLRIWPVVPHVWPLAGELTPEAVRALDESAAFFRERL